MAVRTDPRFGFKYGWESGADGWGADINNNLELLMLMFHLTVISDLLTAPPASPSIGDAYIVASTATGDWATHDDEIAIWWQTPDGTAAAWLFIEDEIGVRAWVQSGVAALKVWDGTAWVAT